MPIDEQSGVYYEVHGEGEPLFLAFPLMASYTEIFGESAGAVKDGFLNALCKDFRVLLTDYPSIGKSRDIPPSELTADRVCQDLLSVTEAAGFERFIYWGYAWGAAVGLQIATRTDRLSGLVVGAWPPLGAAYAEILRASQVRMHDPPKEVQVVLRYPGQYAQWSTFYGSLQDWPEMDALSRIACPRFAFAGAEGDVETGGEHIRNASTLVEHKETLESMGWRVELIPGKGHGVGLEPDVLVPFVRSFLDDVKRGFG